ncbi:LysR family transcriptional regulator [Pseudooceanicola pacificus]|nr:LysR family transcriptional regulator [Pseudooceanicola pacificus]
MEVFVRVVEYGNFSAAARALHLTPSAISKLISRLEDRLGVSLVVRSTRGLQLTREGEVFYDRAHKIVCDIEQSERMVTHASDDASGILSVNSNIPFAQHCLQPIIPDFLAAYPGIVLNLVQSDLPVDLIYQRADVAIRTGKLVDSSLKARKLLESPRHVVAAPAYLEKFGMPKHPNDLKQHNCLNFNLKRSLDIWPFQEMEKGTPTRIDQPVSGNIQVDNGETMRRLAIAGLGLARLSEFHVMPDIQAGRLVPVLEDFNPGDREPVHALFVNQEHLASRIRVFLDFVIAAIKTQTRT